MGPEPTRPDLVDEVQSPVARRKRAHDRVERLKNAPDASMLTAAYFILRVRRLEDIERIRI